MHNSAKIVDATWHLPKWEKNMEKVRAATFF